MFLFSEFPIYKNIWGYRLISNLRGLNAFYAMFLSILCYLQFLLMCLLLDIWIFFFPPVAFDTADPRTLEVSIALTHVARLSSDFLLL